MNIVYEARIWTWAFWHTRPWHNKYGAIADRHGIYCAVCYSKAPTPKENQ